MIRRLTKEIDLDTGVIVREVYSRSRLRHRDPAEGPAEFWRDAETNVNYHEYYFWNGRLHREDGPAEIHRDCATGDVTVEGYWFHGQQHRQPEDGPAEIRRDAETGIVSLEAFYVFGEGYRDPKSGPWYRALNPATGHVEIEHFSEPGDERPSKPVLRKRTKQAGPPSA